MGYSTTDPKAKEERVKNGGTSDGVRSNGGSAGVGRTVPLLDETTLSDREASTLDMSNNKGCSSIRTLLETNAAEETCGKNRKSEVPSI